MNDRYDIEETCDCPDHLRLRELARLRDITRPIKTENGDELHRRLGLDAR